MKTNHTTYDPYMPAEVVTNTATQMPDQLTSLCVSPAATTSPNRLCGAVGRNQAKTLLQD